MHNINDCWQVKVLASCCCSELVLTWQWKGGQISSGTRKLQTIILVFAGSIQTFKNRESSFKKHKFVKHQQRPPDHLAVISPRNICCTFVQRGRLINLALSRFQSSNWRSADNVELFEVDACNFNFLDSLATGAKFTISEVQHSGILSFKKPFFKFKFKFTKLDLNYVIVNLSGDFANNRNFLFCLQRAISESLHCCNTLETSVVFQKWKTLLLLLLCWSWKVWKVSCWGKILGVGKSKSVCENVWATHLLQMCYYNLINISNTSVLKKKQQQIIYNDLLPPV